MPDTFAANINRLIQKSMIHGRMRRGAAMDSLRGYLGLSIDTIYKWRNGSAIPRQPQVIEKLATYGVGRAGLDRVWVMSLLDTSNYDADRESLLTQLFPPASSVVPNNLPHRPVVFMGREDELRSAAFLLTRDAKTWGIALEGLPGVGKTYVALQAAWDAAEGRSCVGDDRFQSIIWTEVPYPEAKAADLPLSMNTHPGATFQDVSTFCAVVLRALDPMHPLLNADQPPSLDVVRNELASRGRVLLIVDGIDALLAQEDRTAYLRLRDFLTSLPAESRVLVTSRMPSSMPAPVRVEPLADAQMGEIIANESRARGVTVSGVDEVEFIRACQGIPLNARVALHVAATVRQKPLRVIWEAERYLGLGYWQYLYGGTLRELEKSQELGAFLVLRLLGFYAASAGATKGMVAEDISGAISRVPRLVPSTVPETDMSCGEVLDQLAGYGLVVPIANPDAQPPRFTLAPLTYSYVHSDRIAALPNYLGAMGFKVDDVLSLEWKNQMVNRAIMLARQCTASAQALFDLDWPNFLAVSQWCLRRYPDAAYLDDLARLWLGQLAVPQDDTNARTGPGDVVLASLPPLGCVGSMVPRDDMERLRVVDQQLIMFSQYIAQASHHPRHYYYGYAATLARAAITARRAMKDSALLPLAEQLLSEAREAEGMGQPFQTFLANTEAEIMDLMR